MRYKLHVAYANREDLCIEAASSVADIGYIHLWPNGDPATRPHGFQLDPMRNTVHEIHRLPPMAPVSIINLLLQESWDDDVMFWMHNDALALPGVAKRVLAAVEDLHVNDPKWGVMFTCYDVLCAFNMRMVREVGFWDPMFFQYTADPEFYLRVAKAGYRFAEFGPGVIHRNDINVRDGAEDNGSATVKADPLFNHRTQWRERTGFDKAYFNFKWGAPLGRPAEEYYAKPFNVG